jgi:hypothetical protein
MHLNKKYGGEHISDKSKKLLDYLKEHDLFFHLQDIEKDGEYHSVVNQQIVNYVLVKYLEIDWMNDDSIVSQFRVPVELLTSDVSRLKACIGPTTFSQKEVIPLDIIDKYKITSEPAFKYGIRMLDGQTYWIPYKDTSC